MHARDGRLTDMPTETAMTPAALKTNIHAPAPHRGRVKLTAENGEVTWCEVYDADGALAGCGPTTGFAPEWAQDQIELRSMHIFPGSMYWLRA